MRSNIITQEIRSRKTKVQRQLRSEEGKIKPLKEQCERARAQRARTRERIVQAKKSYKDCYNTTRVRGNRMEVIEEEVDHLDEEQANLQNRHRDLEDKLRNSKHEITRLENEIREAQDVAVESGIDKKMDDLSQTMNDLQTEHHSVQSCLFENVAEKKKLERKELLLKSKLEELHNIREQKIDVLKKLPQGEDAVKGLEWLSQNRHHFQGQVYDPLLLSIDMLDPKLSAFVENVIPIRDLIAFAAEHVEDVNVLINKLRGSMNLRVNVVHVSPEDSPSRYQPKFTGDVLDGYDFRGYVKDLFRCPDPIKSYLCRLYKVHLIPVFGRKAEPLLDHLVNRMKLKLFFVGDTRYCQFVTDSFHIYFEA